MNQNEIKSPDESVLEDLHKQPLIFMRLAENALTVAESFRDNYLKNTATFISDLRRAVKQVRTEPIMTIHQIENAEWSEVSGEVVTFIDGGVGRVQLSSQVPILLRVGSYCVKTGERNLAEREQFGYYPVILGDLEGGSKDRPDFVDIVRITAELLGGLAALERTPNLRVLMFHGPLVYMMSAYAGHTPFTEKDIDIFLTHYAPDIEKARELKESFLQEANVNIYRKMTDRAHKWIENRVFEPMSWIAFLYKRLIAEAKSRNPVPIICGAVERGGTLREFSEKYLLERIFRSLWEKGDGDYFNRIYGRTDLTAPKPFLDKLGYTDAILLSMLLQPAQSSESWEIDKYSGLRSGRISMPTEAGTDSADFSVLKPNDTFGFPAVRGSYVRVTETSDPIRVETFAELGDEQMTEAVRRVYLYSRLLPGYGFPVGLDVADKYAKVPNWMTDAYAKLIKLHLGISLQNGEISDKQMREILIQSMYMTPRDWVLRPSI
jgi:hypothetical protein